MVPHIWSYTHAQCTWCRKLKSFNVCCLFFSNSAQTRSFHSCLRNALGSYNFKLLHRYTYTHAGIARLTLIHVHTPICTAASKRLHKLIKYDVHAQIRWSTHKVRYSCLWDVEDEVRRLFVTWHYTKLQKWRLSYTDASQTNIKKIPNECGKGSSESPSFHGTRRFLSLPRGRWSSETAGRRIRKCSTQRHPLQSTAAIPSYSEYTCIYQWIHAHNKKDTRNIWDGVMTLISK